MCDIDALSDSSSNNDTITGLYNNEPEYLESELQARENDDSSDNLDSDIDSSRLENLHWCSCENRYKLIQE